MMLAVAEIITRKQARELGLKRFFTNNPCPHGHNAERLVVNGTCLECLRVGAKKYGPIWKSKNKKHIADRERKRCRILAVTDPSWVAKRKKYMKEWRSNSENKKMEKASYKVYKKNHRLEYTATENNRRIKKTLNGGIFSAKDIRSINKAQKYFCAGHGCNKSTKSSFHIDHIIPVSRGGSNWPKNIQILCPSCNVRKNDKDPIVWAQEHGKLL